VSAKYRVAIIGSGRMGGLIEDEIPAGSFSKPYGHFSGYAAVPETEVVAVANRGQARLDRFVQRFGGEGGEAFPTWTTGR
jgi:predicted dehydrogenase